MERRIIGGFIIASGLVLFFNLWARSLENHDYLRYAEVVREMIRSGEWVVPHLNGEIYVDKPPLTFWLIALPSSLYGSVTPLIARLPSALSAWVGVLILFLWGRKVHGRTLSGLISGGVLLSCYQYFFQARLAKTDMLLCLFVLLALYSFYLGYNGSEGKRFLLYALSFFFMGLGALTKGPFGVLIPFPVILIFLIKEGQWRILIGKAFIFGYLLLILTVLPWVLLFVQRVGVDRSIALVRESHVLSRQAPIYFYWGQIWVQFFPWSLLIPSLCFYLWRERGRIWHSEQSLLLLWFALLFIFLTLFKVRVSRYLLPALPPLALLIGGMWRKKVSYFVIPSLLSILVWHSVEFHWVGKNLSNSPGMVLAGELMPYVKDSPLHGYRLNISTVEEVNFYLDRTISLIRRGGDGVERGLVLMPKEVYEKSSIPSKDPMRLVQEFNYKKGKLLLLCKESEVANRRLE